ncbi:MAG: 50S ribosomal protein L23 [Planctomycetes bacterium]|nr:50S ribosomal protein L23 [Planctomycetota bacterium]
MKNPWDILKKPVMSEKSDKAKKQNVYTFIVDTNATKPEIRNAVEKVYGVKVEGVNTVVIKGKFKKEKNMVLYSKRADSKKAFVRLKSGNRIESI